MPADIIYVYMHICSIYDISIVPSNITEKTRGRADTEGTNQKKIQREGEK